ncbi:unnamed protein product [Rotaria magnacalcarata]|uniref:SID1 transmembrane family member 1 n=5 Tax=Rotaria magnacalcarata TaxID=392030 RepID=A0A819IN11_9BILA|nr:unnamed protein product [Rotaria magnacalcarata]CAF2097369.1 unnamed protein product [Rotaria magnacalcarata]CAF3914564.1 unnamed protein product [Rotaria magnacalcarata]
MFSRLIYLFALVILAYGDQTSENSIQSINNPDIEIKNCTFGELCIGAINSSSVHFYSVEYSFDPTMAIRVITNMTYAIEQESPLLIVVRQIRGVISWTLPYTFSNGMIYSSASRILCLQNEINRTRPHMSRVFIEISTSNVDLIDYSIQLENITEFLLETGVSQQFSVSPTMPFYYKFTFPPDIEHVFIDVRSPDQLCTIVSVQSFDCPVYDISEIGTRQGHYQTMASIASFNVYASEFPKRNTFLLVFLVQPTDTDCLNDQEQTFIQPAGVIDIQRQKNATVTLHPPANYNFLYIAIFTTIGLFLMIYFVAFTIMCRNPDIYDQLGPDQLPLLEDIIEREIAERQSHQRGYQTFAEEEAVESTAENEIEQSGGAIAVIDASDVGFVTVSDLCVKNYDYSKQKFRIYPQTMLTVAIFYSLPVIQLVLQYQLTIDQSGNEDMCYFNFLCIRQFAMLTAFNSVFSNIGYCALGLLFLIIVYRRDMAYARFLSKYPAIGRDFGIPQHFGLFYAMGIGLFMEGVMSACYHICPSKQNFQFDTSFMFIIAVLNIIKIYQTRHPDINPHSAGSFSFLAAIIFITVIGVYYDEQWFWIAYATIHILTCLAFTGKIYYMGRLKVTFRVHIHLYRLVKENGIFSRPRYLNRMAILIPTNCLNIAFALYGAIIQPESFPNHLLFVFLGNLAIYLLYYILMKIIHREVFTRFSILFLLSATLSWSSSLYFFYQQVKSYEVQPAISRMRNRPCIILNTYDVHDIWHILSSFSLFFSFLTLLTLDDGIRKRKRKDLAAF